MMNESNLGREWSERWRDGRTGFHQTEFNAVLLEHWPRLVSDPNSRVLVPLCGKSHDMIWLHRRGHSVVGVEMVEMACVAFFAEHEMPYRRIEQDHYVRFVGEGSAEGLTILCADLFSLTEADIGTVDAWYDRAAIVALPPQLRAPYADWMNRMLSEDVAGLMMTFDYPQNEREGPPFSVGFGDIETHFSTAFRVALLDCIDLTEGNRWELSRVHKPVIHLTRR